MRATIPERKGMVVEGKGRGEEEGEEEEDLFRAKSRRVS